MKTFKKVLFENVASFPFAWRNDCTGKTTIKVLLFFDFKKGLRFVVEAGNFTYCDRSLFKAFCKCLEHESVGMMKYDRLKEDTQSKGLWNKL